jgi:hypothetical protein
MKRILNRSIVAMLHRSFDSTIQRFNGLTVLVCALFFSLPAPAQFSPSETGSAHSTSGQFIVSGGRQMSPLASLPDIVADTNLVRLEPALLAVSAERLKESMRRQLGISQSAPWSGQIFLALHPAQSTDEDVAIISTRFLKNWNYRVELPDLVSRTRLARALTGVLLLEFADRDAQSRSAEIPSWLTDGLSQQLSAAGSPENILSPPDEMVNGVRVAQLDKPADAQQDLHYWTHQGSYGNGVIDPLADARQVLKNFPPLTFGQLSWPDDAQVSGADGGAYRASAKLFVSRLLGLPDGPAHLRAMLQNLPRFYNWQTAFQNAFSGNFPTPLDVEKWWALQVVNFSARDPGTQWTPAVSRDKLDEILSVPVEMRAASNSLPTHGEVSIQTAIRNFDPDQRAAILQIKLRDLGLAQFRMAPSLAVLAAAYRQTLADFLGQDRAAAPVTRKSKHPTVSPPQKKQGDIFAKLDALDAQRRMIEEAIKPDVLTTQNLDAPAP